MHTLYYIVVYRPIGSKTWTPADFMLQDIPQGNFFASESKAREAVEGRVVTMPENTLNIKGLEIAIAEVVLAENPDIAIAQPAS